MLTIGITDLEKHINKNIETFSNLVKLFLFEFLNTGILILIVNFNAGGPQTKFPAFNGDYTEFSTGWYRVVGSTIVSLKFIHYGSNLDFNDDNQHFKSPLPNSGRNCVA